MATEYKLSYTAKEIDERLGMAADAASKQYVDDAIDDILPTCSEVNAGNVLSVSSQGNPVWASVINAEEVAY